MNNEKLHIKLVKGLKGRLPSHIATVQGLGLRKMNSERILDNTPEIKGMVAKVKYLLEIKQV
jgi:large subunit ribosomal protein L30